MPPQGTALAAGVIFTIPAMLFLGTWTEIHYLETTIIAALGGTLGVLWMVSLRRALIIKTDLPFPEGVAVAAVLTTTVGDENKKKDHQGATGIWLLIGAIIGALLKFGQVGLQAIQGKIEGITSIGKYNIGGGENNAYIYGGVATSPALLRMDNRTKNSIICTNRRTARLDYNNTTNATCNRNACRDK